MASGPSADVVFVMLGGGAAQVIGVTSSDLALCQLEFFDWFVWR